MLGTQRLAILAGLAVLGGMGCSSRTTGERQSDTDAARGHDGGVEGGERPADDGGSEAATQAADASSGDGAPSSDALVETGGDVPSADAGRDAPAPSSDSGSAVDGPPGCAPCSDASSAMDPCECAARLLGLTFSSGVLEPAFDEAVREYVVEVPLLERRIAMTLELSEGARAVLDGSEIGDGIEWTSAPLQLGHNEVELALVGSDRSYSIDLHRGGVQEAYLKASNTGTEDGFGRSVAVSGDRAVVGAFWEDSSAREINGNQASNSARDSGAAYVFVRKDGVWQQEAYLKADNASSGAFFGGGVAIDGDTIAVAAHEESSEVTRSGSVYVFERDGGAWVQKQRLKATSPSTDAWFGVALTLDGDTLVVGETEAPRGAAYVFERSGGQWGAPQRLVGSDATLNARFGASMALFGDTLVVGASEDTTKGIGAGAAFVFRRQGGSWSEEAALRADNGKALDYFGYSVALRDGQLAVGAPEADAGATDSGAVYVFSQETGGSWEQRSVLAAPRAHSNAFFGSSAVFAGEMLVVGANGDAGSSRGIGVRDTSIDLAFSGAVYTFGPTATGWEEDVYIKASNVGADDAFGYQIAVSGQTLLVGAMLESSNARGVNQDANNDLALHSGAAYVFR